ncbi:hypothetical protein [Streptomyces sp. NPDC056844]|uniref:hypothetical protein n=1 Tax=unclassified Streptomyces TaxID=2593676 RepID=UPI0036B3BE2B
MGGGPDGWGLDTDPYGPAGARNATAGRSSLDGADLDLLAIQLTAPLDGPRLLYVSSDAQARRSREAWARPC